jgi:hypothetical protein
MMLQEALLIKKPDRVSSLSLSLAVFSVLLMPLTAYAQRTSDPNIGHFYMARQQVSITDDSPVINNRMSGAAAPGAAQMPGNGALPAGPMPLAPARWQSFAPPPTAPGLSTSLPQVNKGLPTKGAMPGTGNRGTTGRLPGKGGAGGGGGKPVASINKPSVPVAAGYTPYKKFAVEAPAATSIGNGANGKVYGDVLHWAHQHH